MNRATVVIELAGDAGFSRDLAAGGVFVPGCALRLAEECDLVVCGANHQLIIAARVVYIDEQRGAGLELLGFTTELKAQLAELEPIAPSDLEFLEPAIDDVAPDGSMLEDPPVSDDDLALAGYGESVPLIDLQALEDASEDDLALAISDDGGDGGDGDDGAWSDDELALPVAPDTGGDTAAYPTVTASYSTVTAAYPTVAEPAGDDAAADLGDEADDRAALYDGVLGNRADFDPANPDHAYLMSARTLPPDTMLAYGGVDDEPAEMIDPREPATSTRRVARNVHERLRGLTLAAQLKVAVSGEQHERIVLERLYGKNVWETLLRNPRLTPPEVARIARYGSLPRVLLEIILGNNAWLQVPEVRRALLSNPRLGTDQIMKVLRLTPKHELKLAAIQTAYPQAVRNAARMILRSE